jgi:hypothetical protein
MVARMRLASLTRVTSTQADAVADSPETTARFESAMAKLRAELSNDTQRQQPQGAEIGKVSTAPSNTREGQVLRKQVATFLDLMSQRSLFLGDVGETVRRVNEAAAATIAVERVSVWLLDDERTKITCVDLFERTPARHSAGAELLEREYAPYFAAMRSERTIAAHDAHNDPRTACFSKSYLAPNGINSMLDVPIWFRDTMAGVVCHEHVGPVRTWNADEETFAYLMANFVALAMERAKA